MEGMEDDGAGVMLCRRSDEAKGSFSRGWLCLHHTISAARTAFLCHVSVSRLDGRTHPASTEGGGAGGVGGRPAELWSNSL